MVKHSNVMMMMLSSLPPVAEPLLIFRDIEAKYQYIAQCTKGAWVQGMVHVMRNTNSLTRSKHHPTKTPPFSFLPPSPPPCLRLNTSVLSKLEHEHHQSRQLRHLVIAVTNHCCSNSIHRSYQQSINPSTNKSWYPFRARY